MKSALVQVRVDDETKSRADELFGNLGMDTATAVRLFLVQALQVGGLPFRVLRQPSYNAVTEAAIDEARAIAAGEVDAPAFDSFRAYRDHMGV
ncbi:MAG: type II toxin-antitoxin system RelB/DinJ family antitoxin [Propionibacteriaceae bacterium]|jgi:DNA-damage-inducible protein J|nr:type II toxin-antitoxin system RelB/DinJ family antitoxin [Propionibacteriaceae bacterium]